MINADVIEEFALGVEKDFLRRKEVPSHAYYGIQTSCAVENFPIIHYRVHPVLNKSLDIVKKAAVLAVL